MKETPLDEIEAAFNTLVQRRDIAIILINQHVADEIRALLDAHTAAFPTILEIPTKDHPYVLFSSLLLSLIRSRYDPAKDSVFKRIQKLFGSD